MGGLLLGYRSHTLGLIPADLEYDGRNARTPPSSPRETQENAISVCSPQQSSSQKRHLFEGQLSMHSAPDDQQQQREAYISESSPRSRTLFDNSLGAASYQYQTPRSDTDSSYTASPSYPFRKRRQRLPVAVRSSECLPLLGSYNLAYTTNPDSQHSTYQNACFPPGAMLTYAFPPYHLQMADCVPYLSTNAARAQDITRYGLQRLQDPRVFRHEQHDNKG
jgi:hypothetical protein